MRWLAAAINAVERGLYLLNRRQDHLLLARDDRFLTACEVLLRLRGLLQCLIWLLLCLLIRVLRLPRRTFVHVTFGPERGSRLHVPI